MYVYHVIGAPRQKTAQYKKHNAALHSTHGLHVVYVLAAHKTVATTFSVSI
jgi:hypothetical protein